MLILRVSILLFKISVFFLSGPCLIVAALDDCSVVETPASRSYFYVGGQYVSDGSGGSLLQGQMYVEHLPGAAKTSRPPIVFIHGQGQTGTNWLNTPDGREGWASWYLRRGHEVYLVDQPQRGRSPYIPGDGNISATFPAEVTSEQFTAVELYKAWPQAYLHTQWPGNGTKGDPIFDQFYATQVQFETNVTKVSYMVQNAGAALLDRIGPVVLITHSQGGPLGFLIADARPDLVKSLISLEPEGPPFKDRMPGTDSDEVSRPWGLTYTPVTYEPPVENVTGDLPYANIPPAGPNLTDCFRQAGPAKKLVNLSKVPMLVVTAEASYHAGYDYCTVQYLQQAGVNAQHLELSKTGIHGNGHFIFMEKNNLEIAAKIEQWILNESSNKTGQV